MHPTRVDGLRSRRFPAAVLASFSALVVASLVPLLGTVPADARAKDLRAAGRAAAGDLYLVAGLPDDDLAAFSAVVAGRPGATLLVDTPKTARLIDAFTAASPAGKIVPVGAFKDVDLDRRLSRKTEPAVAWTATSLDNWKAVGINPERIVLSPTRPRALWLQAAYLAGVLRAPLVPVGPAASPDDVRKLLGAEKPAEVYAVGTAATLKDVTGQVIPLPDARSVNEAALKIQLRGGPVTSLILANPADSLDGKSGMSVLAPWVAVQRRGALLLTEDSGTNASALITDALARPDLRAAENLLLVADLKAVPTDKRPNPVPGKDKEIEMEPGTPANGDPFSFATGRLFHEDPAVVTLMLARERLLFEVPRPRKALVVSNPGEGLPLLETFSRHTCHELRNAGYDLSALFGEDVGKEQVRKLLPDQDIFLWEGHYKTLINRFEFLTWSEPLQPSLVFLQSCLALNQEEAQPLFQRGAVAVVGSSTRTYSATGGAFTLAFFDALTYEEETLGGALRHAKNFLQSYSVLKERRLSDKAKLSGVNVRSSWAFTLWGDPTLKLPRPKTPADALKPVRHRVKGDTIEILLPGASYEAVKVEKYEAQMQPNCRLAGLLTSGEDEETRRLVPFTFAEVGLPQVPDGKTPILKGKLSERSWVFTWDARRKVGYLLVTPRGKDAHVVRFHVSWEE